MLTGLNLLHKLELGYAAGCMALLLLSELCSWSISPVWALLLTLSSYLPLSFPLCLKAVRTLLRSRRLNEQFLMLIATLGALALGDYPEALAVLIFYEIGELFEAYAQGRARREITSLVSLKPEFARILRSDGQEEQVKPRKVRVGEKIRVLAGESVPLDGLLLTPAALVNTAALTGESEPRLVKQGEEVLSGCLNTSSMMELQVVRAYQDSSLTRLLNLIEDAAANKSRPEALISRFAAVYTPLVVSFALLLALMPLLLPGASFADWGRRALVFLIVSCPCALVLSVPLSFFGGLGALSKLGVMVKGSVYLEHLAKLRLLCFDKTGTLTSGRFSVIAVQATEGQEQELLKVLYALEAHSVHPLAEGVCAYAKERGLYPSEIEELCEQAGYGLHGRLEGEQVIAGRKEYVEEKLSCPLPDPEERGTAIYVSRGQRLLGVVILRDEPRGEAFEVLRELDRLQVKTCLITGDRKEPACQVGRELGLSQILYEQLPQDKLENFRKLKEQEGLTGFVGDGLNDAPVLAASDVGFALGQFGSAAACEAADVVIMNDDLHKIPLTLRIARKTYQLALSNIWLSLSVKFLILLLGALGLASLWLAIFGDVGVLILSVLNAMRSLQFVKLGSTQERAEVRQTVVKA